MKFCTIYRSEDSDPSLGFFHALTPGRETLMLDILEPLRPEIDRFVFGLLDNPLGVEDFISSEQDGCRLAKEGRKAFYHLWTVWVGEDVVFHQTIRDVVRDVIDILDPPSRFP